MTRVFHGALLTLGGVALFVLGWYVGSQKVALPGIGEFTGVDRRATYETDRYSVRYPVSWKVVELTSDVREGGDIARPIHHVAFNRQVSEGGQTFHDCTLEVRTYAGAAAPSLEEWARRVLGVTNSQFGGEVSFDRTTIGGKEGVSVQGGSDLFVEHGGHVFYLTVGTKIAESKSREAGDSCRQEVNSMLRSFTLK